MNNKITLYREGLPLRLRQVGLAALTLAESKRVKLCVDPQKTTDEKVAFFVRTPQGKPNRRAAQISEILSEAAAPYEGKVIADKGTLSLVKEEAPKKSRSSKKEADPGTEKTDA